MRNRENFSQSRAGKLLGPVVRSNIQLRKELKWESELWEESEPWLMSLGLTQPRKGNCPDTPHLGDGLQNQKEITFMDIFLIGWGSCSKSSCPELSCMTPLIWALWQQLTEFLFQRSTSEVNGIRRHQRHHGPWQIATSRWSLMRVTPRDTSTHQTAAGGQGQNHRHHPEPSLATWRGFTARGKKGCTGWTPALWKSNSVRNELSGVFLCCG